MIRNILQSGHCVPHSTRDQLGWQLYTFKCHERGTIKLDLVAKSNILYSKFVTLLKNTGLSTDQKKEACS